MILHIGPAFTPLVEWVGQTMDFSVETARAGLASVLIVYMISPVFLALILIHPDIIKVFDPERFPAEELD